MSQKAILFDMDDTLYPERAYVMSGFRPVAEYIGQMYGLDIEEIYVRLNIAFENGIRGNIFNRVLEDLDIPLNERLIQKLVTIYRNHKPNITLYPDVKFIFPRLRPYFRLGLLTDGYAQVQRLKVKALNIESWFDTIIYSDDFGRKNWKPSTVPFEALLQALGVEPAQAVYVGDNPKKDFIGARKLCLKTIRIIRPATEHSDLVPMPGFEADYDIEALYHLFPLLTKIFALDEISA